MSVPDSVHRTVRRLVGWYPFRTPSYELNVFLSWIGFDGKEPRWLAATPRGDVPGIVLNVANRYHRKNFYFLKAYFRQARAQPLGRFLSQTLTPGGVFLDIGAHIGFYSFYAAQLVGDSGIVYAFEPEPITLESLTRSAELNSLPVQVRGVALSDAPGELPFYRASAQAHSLVAGVDGDARYSGERFVVPVTTLDGWSVNEGLDVKRIQAIKVDVEGFEAHTVAGGLAMLERAGLPPIWCEVRGPDGSTRAPNTFVAVLDKLTPLGYKPYRWNQGEHTPVTVADVLQREDILFRTA